LNITLFSKKDIRRYVSTAVVKQRTESFFLLGLSVAKITSYQIGLHSVRAFSQLIEEWEYFNSGYIVLFLYIAA